MATNSTTAELPAKGPTYPCLRRSLDSGLVVLFISPNVGTVLHAGQREGTSIGVSQNGWISASDTTVWEKCSITLTSAD